MAARRAGYVLECHVLNVETGLWCPECALPSGVEVAIALVAPETLLVLRRVTEARCHDCGRKLS